MGSKMHSCQQLTGVASGLAGKNGSSLPQHDPHTFNCCARKLSCAQSFSVLTQMMPEASEWAADGGRMEI